jgi:hypothetical protein
MAAATLTTGTVKYGAGQPRPTKNGPRINALVILPDGEEVRLWGDPGDFAIEGLRKGQSVQLVESKGGYKLVEQKPPTIPTSQSPESAEAAFDASLGREVARYTKAVSAAKAIAHQQLGLERDHFDTVAGKALIKEIAVTLLIGATRS